MPPRHVVLNGAMLTANRVSLRAELRVQISLLGLYEVFKEERLNPL